MQMQGPTTGACSGAAFQNDGNDITIADSNESPPESWASPALHGESNLRYYMIYIYMGGQSTKLGQYVWGLSKAGKYEE